MVRVYTNILFAVATLALLPNTPRAAENEALPPAFDGDVDYANDVLPIFEAHCFKCHGPQRQKGDLRLDQAQGAIRAGYSGESIIPGDSGASMLIQNVARLGDAIPMPPKGDPLTTEQIAILRKWIDDGASFGESDGAIQVSDEKPRIESDHWAFQKPVRPDPPAMEPQPENPIDAFVLQKLEKEGLSPAEPADRITLIRRLHLDLIGLPPSIAEVDAFVNDDAPDAYEKLVDRLLASPHYGERWGRRWLDAARYADTNGYEKDRPREMWAWRDWVINAINDDMPFDQFTVEQMAGDMLPNATRDQIVATGFHRNSMINEEGGVDVEQFRYESIVDRVGTTSTVFLGLTVACAQCHDHKYDPITQRDYFETFAFLNNADEPKLKVPTQEQVIKRREHLARIQNLVEELDEKFPAYEEKIEWSTLAPNEMKATGGALLKKLDDDSVLAFGFNPDKTDYSVTLAAPAKPLQTDRIRLELLTDDSLPRKGPGRVKHGNAVLSEFELTLNGEPLKIARAEADFEQAQYGIAGAIDGTVDKKGWGLAKGKGQGSTNENRTASFFLEQPIELTPESKIEVALRQQYGGQHTIGRFRISAGQAVRTSFRPDLSETEQRRLHLEEKLAEWEAEQLKVASQWKLVDPDNVVSEKAATMNELDDHSILATGIVPNRDTYVVDFPATDGPITAFRLEALPHPSLPNEGPGRGDLVNPGNFMLSEVTLERVDAAGERHPVKIANASASYEHGDNKAAKTLDGQIDSGWAIGSWGKGKPGEDHAIVFELAEPLDLTPGSPLVLTLVQSFVHQDVIGRFRVHTTSDPAPFNATVLRAEIETALHRPVWERSLDDAREIETEFLRVAPELKAEHAKIDALHAKTPELPTTMVLQERADTRQTHIHMRGEFLSTGREVQPATPSVLHVFPEDLPQDRLGFAEWLVSDENPLLARVTVNRYWQGFFGRGIVATAEDFGTQGDPPTHPQLLDWLATEFMANGWSRKAIHRQIVTSATYRQASELSPQLLERDPENRLLARGPRHRLEGEIVRDIALTASGLLSRKIGGPSVYPPQPEGVTELSYGQLNWPTSKGEDRYRRGLYTFFKRTSPYPMLTTFDGPTAEAACVRRVRSNTPLQALTLLNDEVFVECAQAMAARVLKEAPEETTPARATYAFRLLLSREPADEELARLVEFHDAQLERFEKGDLEAAQIAAASTDESSYPTEHLATWTTLCRALLNLDETVTKD